VSLRWSIGDSEPERVGRVSGTEEIRRVVRSTRVASGTLACPACDAPVAPGPLGLSPADGIVCPFCRHVAPVRSFLSLATPGRPARVEVHVRGVTL